MNDTIFASYYNEIGELKTVTMLTMYHLISNKKNKTEIANWVFHRLYNRFLKPFFFDEAPELLNNKKIIDLYRKQYKHGFTIMTNCCVLIETLAGFLTGEDKTGEGKGKAVNSYKIVFDKAGTQFYNNELSQFKNISLYGSVRCGLLHQGETYDKFVIGRKNQIIEDNKKINASKFAEALRKFLQSYKSELEKDAKWDGELWDNCRKKIRHIITNS